MFATRATLIVSIVTGLATSACARRAVSYKKDVQPILEGNCGTFHSDDGVGYQASGFSVAGYKALMQSTEYGPVIVAGHGKQSNFVRLLQHGAHASINMPKICEKPGVPADKCTSATSFARRLPQSQVDVIARWIDQGARNN